MFGDGSLTLQEFAMRDPLPLAQVQEAILEFLRRRKDAALFGAQAVNAYVDEPRMTQDVDILSSRASALAEELRTHLSTTFHIAVRIRAVAQDKGFRIYQLREPKNRHLAAIRQIDPLPPTRLISEIQFPIPEELIAQKVIAYASRRRQPKSGTDWRDIMLLLQTHPALKQPNGPVGERLLAASAGTNAMAAWIELATLVPPPPDRDDDAGY
jgi:hypothetical protein